MMLKSMLRFAFENGFPDCLQDMEDFRDMADTLAEHGLQELYQFDEADFPKV